MGKQGGRDTGQQAGGGSQHGTGVDGCGPVPGQGQHAGGQQGAGQQGAIGGQQGAGQQAAGGLQIGRQGFGKGS